MVPPHIGCAQDTTNMTYEEVAEINKNIDIENSNRERQYWNSFKLVDKHNEEESEKELKDPSYKPDMWEYPDDVEYIEYLPYPEKETPDVDCNCEVDEYYINHSGDYSSYAEYEASKEYNEPVQETNEPVQETNKKPKLRISTAMRKYKGRFFPLNLLAIGR